jgi:outer membrane biosynthesis protein TonB
MPVFPPAHYRSGAVVMGVIINKAGKIVDIKVISGREDLRAITVDAVRKWTYKPYLLNGEAVFVKTTVVLQVDFGA